MTVDNTQIIYGVNSEYLFPALVSIHSIWKHARQPVDVTIYGENWGPGDHAIVSQTTKMLGGSNKSIVVKDFDSSVFEEYSKTKTHYPTISLLPLMLPRLVDHRCLFMDADTLVLEDICELLEMPLNGRPIGACADIGQVYLTGSLLRTRLSDVLNPKRTRKKREVLISRCIALQAMPYENYFNSGVLIMDCASIRAMYAKEEYLNAEALQALVDGLPDQDRLNQLFAGNWLQIPLTWNTSLGLIRRLRLSPQFRQVSDKCRQDMETAMDSPKIWHFHGARKPWEKHWHKEAFSRPYRDYRAALREFKAKTGLKFRLEGTS